MNEAKAVGVFFLIAVLSMIAWFVFRDFYDSNTCHHRLKNLTMAEIQSIVIGHQLVNSPEKINAIVQALNGNTISSRAAWVRNIDFAINLQEGKKIDCVIQRCFEEPHNTILRFNAGSLYEVSLKVAGLVDVLTALKIDLPSTGIPRITDGGRISEGIDLKSISTGTNKPYTLYSIERSKILDDPNNANGYFMGGLVLFGLLLQIIYIAFVVKDRSPRSFRDLAGMLFFILILSGLSWLAVDSGIKMINFSKQYRALRRELQEGKCKSVTGVLTDITYKQGSHGTINLHMIEVNGHKFFFSTDRIDRTLCDADSWKDLVPEHLRPGTKVSVWYADTPDGKDIPEHVAKIDIE